MALIRYYMKSYRCEVVDLCNKNIIDSMIGADIRPFFVLLLTLYVTSDLSGLSR